MSTAAYSNFVHWRKVHDFYCGNGGLLWLKKCCAWLILGAIISVPAAAQEADGQTQAPDRTLTHGFLTQHDSLPTQEAMPVSMFRLDPTEPYTLPRLALQPVLLIVASSLCLILLFALAWIALANRKLVLTKKQLLQALLARQQQQYRSMQAADTPEEQSLQAEQHLSHIVFLHSNSGILVTGKNNRIVHTNPAFTNITGYSREEVLGQSPNVLSSGHHGPDFYQELWTSLEATGKWTGEVVNRHKSGHTFFEQLSIVLIRDAHGEITHYIAIFSDISRQKQLILKLQHSANHDMLTGLPNHNLVQDRIKSAIAQARRSKTHIAVIFIDLDGFKPVNDTYGHAAGDLLLKSIGIRMRDAVREVDTVARVGGDEFVVILDRLETPDEAIECGQRILALINQPIELQRTGQAVQVSASLGMLICKPMFSAGFDPSPKYILERADKLMYQAKHTGKARMVFQTLNDHEWHMEETVGHSLNPDVLEAAGTS